LSGEKSNNAIAKEKYLTVFCIALMHCLAEERIEKNGIL